MRPEDVEITTDRDLAVPYEDLGYITARVSAAFPWSKARSMDDVNIRLREEAMRRGANVITSVCYERDRPTSSYVLFFPLGLLSSDKSIVAHGMAARVESELRPCPFCAEPVRSAAVVCRFCGRDLDPQADDREIEATDPFEWRPTSFGWEFLGSDGRWYPGDGDGPES